MVVASRGLSDWKAAMWTPADCVWLGILGPAWRARIGEMIAAQVVEDEADLQVRRGRGLYPRYTAVLNRVLGNKGRAAMTLPGLEAALAWLERNRLADFLHLLDGDARYAWEARQRAAWRPRTGRGGQGTRKDVRS